MSEEEKKAYMKYCKYNKEPKEVIIELVGIIEKQQKELEQEKEKNKNLQKQLNGAFDRGFISKDKIKEIQGQLCMQLGSYVRDEASPEQERIAGGINIINKILEEK